MIEQSCVITGNDGEPNKLGISVCEDECGGMKSQESGRETWSEEAVEESR